MSFMTTFSFSQVVPTPYIILTLLYFGIAFLFLKNGSFAKDLYAIGRQLPILFSVICTAMAIKSFPLEPNSKAFLYLLFATLYNLPLLITNSSKQTRSLPHFSHMLTGLAVVTVLINDLYGSTFLLLITTLLIIQLALQLFARKVTHGITHPFYIVLAHLSLCACLQQSLAVSTLTLPLSILPILYHFLYQKCKSTSFMIVGILTYLLAWLSYLGTFLMSSNPSLTIQIICIVAPLTHYTLCRMLLLRTIPYTSGYLISGSTLLLALFLIKHTDQWYLFTAATGLCYLFFEEKKRFSSLTVIGLLCLTFSFLAVVTSQTHFIEQYTIIAFAFIGYFILRSATQKKFQQNLTRLYVLLLSSAFFLTSTILTTTLIGSLANSISWALIGFTLLSIGLFLKDSTFRSMGFTVLALCLLHVYFIDVWRLHALLRIGSFITLGGVLLLAGYFYCRKDSTDRP